MGICVHCGNEYDKSFHVELSDGERHTFEGLVNRCTQEGWEFHRRSVRLG